ncbi:MAG: hypothetical protein QNJ30_03365 [Kiloniellales bacterium]|nr:hypothetical protein [Kiloniellales bacterium]
MSRFRAVLALAILAGLAACQSASREALPTPGPAEDAALVYADSDAGWAMLDQFRDVLGGGVVDAMLSDQDQRHFRNAAGEALESRPEGGKTSWYNPLSGNGGQFNINSAFRGPDGRPCKRLTQKVLAGGRAHVVQSIACKANNGTWGGLEG